jgi:2-methylaconitate cis-trans-isomerase PrpF
MKQAIRCAIMRGGTSKAVIFSAAELPADPGARDALILAAFGSPDPRQIDGLGGADPLTSKVAIVGPASDPDSDVDYTFGQVGIRSPTVNYAVTCGNTAAAVALYALQERLVQPVPGRTLVQIHCTNNDRRIQVSVPEACNDAGGSLLHLDFMDPAGGNTGQLLPSGRPVDEIRTAAGRLVRFSLVDCGNLYAILRADAWSLSGAETADELEAMTTLKQEVEEIREAVAARFLADDAAARPGSRPAARLKVAIVGPPDRKSVDVVARIINPERVHQVFAVTGAMCLAAAASIPGTIVAELAGGPLPDGRSAFRIGHPKGVIAPEIDSSRNSGLPRIRSIRIDRTARRIMDGIVYIADRGPGQ